MVLHYVYITTNLITGQQYIGKHSTDNESSNYLGSGTRLLKAIRKYGKENFSKEVVSTHYTEDEAYLAEDALIDKLNAIESEKFYNIVKGGRGGGFDRKLGPRDESKIRKGWNHSDEAKQKISEAHKGKENWHKGKLKSDETRAKMAVAQKGRIVSDATREKISAASSGTRNSNYGTMWITNEDENMKINNKDAIPDGWRKGRVFKKGYKHVRD
jgi:group I intron endonuclease